MKYALIFCLSLIMFVSAEPAEARQSDWGLGVNINTPYYVDPVRETGDTSVNLHGEWTLRRWVGLFADTEFAVNGFHEVFCGLGLRTYAFNNYPLRPFIEGSGVVQFHPESNAGLRAGLGLAWNLGRAVGADRIWLHARWNMTFLAGEPRSLFFDLYRIGLTTYY